MGMWRLTATFGKNAGKMAFGAQGKPWLPAWLEGDSNRWAELELGRGGVGLACGGGLGTLWGERTGKG